MLSPLFKEMKLGRMKVNENKTKLLLKVVLDGEAKAEEMRAGEEEAEARGKECR